MEERSSYRMTASLRSFNFFTKRCLAWPLDLLLFKGIWSSFVWLPLLSSQAVNLLFWTIWTVVMKSPLTISLISQFQRVSRVPVPPWWIQGTVSAKRVSSILERSRLWTQKNVLKKSFRNLLMKRNSRGLRKRRKNTNTHPFFTCKTDCIKIY